MKISQPTPELPVPNVQEAQAYYRDRLGFDVAWYHEEGRIGAVAHGDCAIFFRECQDTSNPSVFWVFTDDVDEAYKELLERGADVGEKPVNTAWGLRQFTLRDAYGNTLYFHHDL